MKRVFENTGIQYHVQGKHQLHIDEEGIIYVPENRGKPLAIRFAEVGSIFLLRYCNSNQSYTVTFRNLKGKDIGEIQTDVRSNPGQHNIQETKSILIAFAENKLTGKFPDNIDELDLKIALSLTEKEIRVKNGTLAGGKHQVKFSDIRRVKCISNGTLSNLYIYTRDKSGFFDVPDMKVPVNELTLPILEAVLVRNTGKGIDFSIGNGFDQKTSEYILIRYMNASFFANEDGSVTDDWHKIAYDHIRYYQSDINIAENAEGE